MTEEWNYSHYKVKREHESVRRGIRRSELAYAALVCVGIKRRYHEIFNEVFTLFCDCGTIETNVRSKKKLCDECKNETPEQRENARKLLNDS
ncbi:MAG: hypothetical protein HN402_07965 [Candidatus Scalindua sp.]|jgi:hypothetical protein|nr:hypothetical protein [Candidatus Scalindua sp.]MBT6757792.1 hypothetical protein [Candidatus Jacksonbacteria bacterium]